jgi:hypothetical protein
MGSARKWRNAKMSQFQPDRDQADKREPDNSQLSEPHGDYTPFPAFPHYLAMRYLRSAFRPFFLVVPFTIEST